MKTKVMAEGLLDLKWGVKRSKEDGRAIVTSRSQRESKQQRRSQSGRGRKLIDLRAGVGEGSRIAKQ